MPGHPFTDDEWYRGQSASTVALLQQLLHTRAAKLILSATFRISGSQIQSLQDSI
jgi:hypothetical protein